METNRIDINQAGLIVGVLGLITGALSLIYAIYTTQQFTKGVKIGALLQIRALINLMDAEKRKRPLDPKRAEAAMDFTQRQLDEVLFRSLQKIFKVADKDAPR